MLYACVVIKALLSQLAGKAWIPESRYTNCNDATGWSGEILDENLREKEQTDCSISSASFCGPSLF